MYDYKSMFTMSDLAGWLVTVVTLCLLTAPTAALGDEMSGNSTPPSKITDLQVAHLYCKSGIIYVTLTWTAPHRDSLGGARYDIRVAESEYEIKNKFVNSPKIDPGLIVNGSFVPHLAGATEELTTSIPEHAVWLEYVFAIRTYDSSSLASPVSNPVSVRTCPVSTTTTSILNTPMPDTSSTVQTKRTSVVWSKNDNATQIPLFQPSNESSINTGAVVGGIIAGVLVCVGIGVLLVALKVKASKTAKLHPDTSTDLMAEDKTFPLQ